MSDSLPVLTHLVAREADRTLSAEQLAPDPARVAEGWVRRFVADGRRADEALALYRSLGFEAVADPIRQEELRPGCDDCKVVTLLHFKTIYTRKLKDS